MKVLFLTRLYKPHIGGVEKHVEKVSQILSKQGFEITIITTQYEGSVGTKDFQDNIRIIRIPKREAENKWKLWSWVNQHRHLFNEADLVHAHDVFWWYLPLRAQYLGKPVFTTFHGWEGVFPPTSKAKLWRKAAEKLSRGNICVGDFIEKWYGTKPNFVTYGGTDMPPLPEGDANRILVLGRLSRDNDTSTVLKGLQRVKNANPNIKVTFLGDGEYAWDAEKLGKVLGFQEKTDDHLALPRWVIASSYLSMLDAMASGRYVFSFHSNPLKKDYLDLHPAAEAFSRVNSPKMFEQVFFQCCNSVEATRAKTLQAQQWALTQTWDKVAQTYIDLWTEKNLGLALRQLKQM